MKTYQEACNHVKRTKMVIAQSGLGYDEHAQKGIIKSEILLIADIYGIAVDHVEKDIEGNIGIDYETYKTVGFNTK
jgi:hypothetical protein